MRSAKPTPSQARLLRHLATHPDSVLRIWYTAMRLVPASDAEVWHLGEKVTSSRETAMVCARMGWIEGCSISYTGWEDTKPRLYRLTDVGHTAIEGLGEESFVSVPSKHAPPSVKGKSGEVMRALAARHSIDDGWVFIPEAPMPSPGGAHRVDALAINCYSYRKWPLVGYEIKVSRSDFMGELRNPAKTAKSATFCSAFYFACPAGLVEAKEVPDPYGLMIVKPNGKTRIMKHSHLERMEPTWEMVALLVRRLAQFDEVEDDADDE